MKNKKIWIAIALIAFVFVAVSFAQAAPKVVNVSTSLDVKKANLAANSFTWSGDKDKALAITKDVFDPAAKAADGTTGASKQGSTAKFNGIYRDNGKDDGNQTMPAGFRGLLLYSVSSYDTLKGDAFQVTTEKDKSFTIRFVHRGVAYQIKTDAKGGLNFDSGFKKLTVCDSKAGAFVLKADYLQAGKDASKMENVDWAKVEPKLEADAATSPTVKYGVTKAAVKYADASGMLTIAATLGKK